MSADKTLVVTFSDMPDDVAIQHLRARHVPQLAGLNFTEEPDRLAAGLPRRFLSSRENWNEYHARVHRTQAEELDHTHEE